MDAANQAARGRNGPDRIETWLFDLDNTLYHHSCNLFAQIDQRMGAYIADLLGVDRVEARRVQKTFFHEHGTTLRGLMIEHGVEPDDFLAYVHQIDHSPVPPNPALDAALANLDGAKYVFTNASAEHAEKVIARLGVGHHFEDIFDIAAADYLPKPDPATYDRLVRRHAMKPEATAFIDDIPRNLAPAAALGMTTVWLRTKTEYAQVGAVGGHIHHIADDLVAWLEDAARAQR